jgi:spermidine synthase
VSVLSRAAARILVFVTSASVLIVEILAGRLLAPYLGVSLEVFTGIIGVILAGISLGAWLGGRMADRVEPTLLPGPLMIAGGLAAIASPPLIDLLGPSLGDDPVSIVLLTAVGFLIPAALLSAVTPVVVKIRLESISETGRVVGSYSAIGTAGAILGTFLTGFFLIAAFPTRPIVGGLGITLVVWGALVGGLRRRLWVSSVIVVAVGTGGLLAATGGPCQFETSYHCAQVVVDPQRPTGRLLVLDRGFNSYVDLENPTHLEFRYARVMADVISTTLPDGPLGVLSIGGGGFTFPNYLDAVRPGTRHVVLEIDAMLVDIGHSDLGFKDQAEVIIDDARRSIQDVPLRSVDLVIGDAFSGLTVPWHLTTVEFIRIVESRMRPEGVYVINVIDYGDLDFARATANTMNQVFRDVAVIAPQSYIAGNAGGNFVVVGSNGDLDFSKVEAAIAARSGTEIVASGSTLDAFTQDSLILSDDYAPVDQMIDHP